MKTLFLSKLTLVWALLCAGTLISQFIGGANGEPTDNTRAFGVMILVIAFLKAHLVLHYFMGLDKAPMQWRLVFGAWVIVVAGLLIFLL